MPHCSRSFTNYVPPRERALLKTILENGRPKILRSSQKDVQTLRDIIQVFAPHHNQLILDPFAGTMSTVVASLAERRPVLALEMDKTCFELGSSRVDEFGYLQTADQMMAARIPDA
jgi:DNA modification methylase